jgi:hypothetical protein
MDPSEIVSRIVQSANGDGICDPCLAFAVELPLTTVQSISKRLVTALADYERNVIPCESCGRVTETTRFTAAAITRTDFGRVRKCVRCSRRVTKDEEEITNGDVFHRQCLAIARTEAEIANSRQTVKLTDALIRRTRDRLDARNRELEDPIAHATIAGRISEGLLAGRLPRAQPTKSFARDGSGKTCDGCGDNVDGLMLERELQFDGHLPIRLHAACAAIWLAMLRHSENRTRSSSRPAGPCSQPGA